MVASDHVIIAGTPQPRDASCLLYCAMADSKHNRWGLPDGRAKPDWSHNAEDTYPVEIRGDAAGLMVLTETRRPREHIKNICKMRGLLYLLWYSEGSS